MDFWDFFWLLVWSFLFVAFLMVLFQIFGDLFRDPDLSWVGEGSLGDRAHCVPVPGASLST